MITMLTYTSCKKDIPMIKSCTFEIMCRLSDDDWDFFGFNDRISLNEFIETGPVIDILCVDVTADGGITFSEQMRKKNSKMCIIILSDSTVTPMLYIKPTIMPSSLILRPLETEKLRSVFFDSIKDYIKKFADSADKEFFTVNNRDGRQYIPYEQIVFFESRSKKVFVNTEKMEYSFYDTLDNLERTLNDSFVRCHRSFIVSRTHIKQIKLSQNIIILDDGRCVPLSRSYKTAFKGGES